MKLKIRLQFRDWIAVGLSYFASESCFRLMGEGLANTASTSICQHTCSRCASMKAYVVVAATAAHTSLFIPRQFMKRASRLVATSRIFTIVPTREWGRRRFGDFHFQPGFEDLGRIWEFRHHPLTSTFISTSRIPHPHLDELSWL